MKIANKYNQNYVIKFANPSIWNQDVLANYLGKVNVENTVLKEGVAIKQAGVRNAVAGNRNTIKEEEPPTVTVSLKLKFYDKNNSESSFLTTTVEVPLGSTINFQDASSLQKYGISMPEYFEYSYTVSDDLNGNWDECHIYTISEIPDDGHFTIEIWGIDTSKIDTTKIDVKFKYYYRDEQDVAQKIEGTEQVLKIPWGAHINFNDPSNLASYGIIIPTGYTFYHAASKELCGDWHRC